ncbi:cation diffusion facilitator family transporter [Streptomyces capparidis]|jgi:cobalt-zinc-cadmium efflux system protein
MGAGHAHGHGHAHHGHGATAGAAHRGRLRIALALTLVTLAAQVVGSFVTGSLALFADAGHMATDAAGIAMALAAIHIAGRPATDRRTFGYARAEILAAMANAVLLIGVGAYIAYESVQRLLHPSHVEGAAAVAFAAVGLVANVVALSLLTGGRKESLNVKGAYLEVLADTLGSLAVIAAAAVVWGTGFTRADPIASLVIAAMIVPRTWQLLREALDVLLEAAPRHVDLAEVRAHLLALPAVEDLHDLHAWTITSGLPVLSAHVVVDERALAEHGHEKILHDLQDCLGDHFDVEHCTFQLEPAGHAAHEAGLCH